MTGDIEKYIGDGLYVAFDGFAFTLRAPRGDGDHYVYLEPHVLREFLDFVERMRKRDD